MNISKAGAKESEKVTPTVCRRSNPVAIAQLQLKSS